MRRHYAAACALLLAFCAAVGAPTSFADDTPPPAPTTTPPEPELDIGDFLLGEINTYRRETRRRERLIRVHRTPASSVAERSNDREQRLLRVRSK